MKNNLIKLNELISAEKSADEILVDIKKELTRLQNKPNAFFDWQLIAGYLDSKIFEFIVENRTNDKVQEFGAELAQDLADKFGLNRTIN
jgi:hypothetical protein